MSSYMAKTDANGKPSNFEQQWWVIDATDQVVGRLATTIATILRGKHKPQYTPHQDTGDYVIVINAEKVKFTGRKWEQKTYQTYSHHPGGQRIITAADLLQRFPERILENAIRRMVPRTPLGRKQMDKVKIYKGPRHDHQAQQPKEFKTK